MIRSLFSRYGDFSRREFGISLIIVSLAVIAEVFLLLILRVRNIAIETGAPSYPLFHLTLSLSGLMLTFAIPYVLSVSMVKRLRSMMMSGWSISVFWGFFLLNVIAHRRWAMTGMPLSRLLVIFSLLGMISFLAWLTFAKPRKAASENTGSGSEPETLLLEKALPDESGSDHFKPE